MIRYFIYANENTRARLCVDETRTSSKAVRDMVVAHYEAQGLLVTVKEEF